MRTGVQIERFDLQGKKCMTVSGVDWGTHLVILKETDTHILCRRPGCKCWQNLMVGYVYCSPEFIVFEKEGAGVKNSTGDETFEYTRENKKEIKVKAFETFERKGQEEK